MTCHLSLPPQGRTRPMVAAQTHSRTIVRLTDWLRSQYPVLGGRSVFDVKVAAEHELKLGCAVTDTMLAHAALRALDMTTATPPAPGRGPRVLAADTDPVVVRMAKTMSEAAPSGGACDAYDLAEAGFTPGEIIEHLPAATRLAAEMDGRAEPEIVR